MTATRIGTQRAVLVLALQSLMIYSCATSYQAIPMARKEFSKKARRL